MLFNQIEGTPQSASFMAPVLFIQIEDVLAEKENKNLKVVERFRVEREFAHGNL